MCKMGLLVTKAKQKDCEEFDHSVNEKTEKNWATHHALQESFKIFHKK